jgi:hypothetical protein
MTAWNYHIWNQALWELVMSCFLPGEAVTYRATAAPRAHQLEKLLQLWSKNGHGLQRLQNFRQPSVSSIHPPLASNHGQLPRRLDASESSAA